VTAASVVRVAAALTMRITAATSASLVR